MSFPCLADRPMFWSELAPSLGHEKPERYQYVGGHPLSQRDLGLVIELPLVLVELEVGWEVLLHVRCDP